MATNIAQPKPVIGETRQQLEAIIATWEARWQKSRLVWRISRALLITLVILVVALLFARSFGILSQGQAISVAIVGVMLGIGLCVGWIYRKRPAILAARQFDALFELQERTSTALEIDEGRIRTAPQIASEQIQDALVKARSVEAGEYIEVQIRWAEWILVVACTIALMIVLLLPSGGNGGFDTGISGASQAAIDDAQETVRDITEDIANSTALTAEERTSLLETLESSLDDLQSEPNSTDEAFAAMNNVEQSLRELANQFNENTRTQNEAFTSASESMRNDGGQVSNNQSDDQTAIAEFQALVDQAQTDIATMTPEELAQMQENLSQAAQDMANTDNNLSQALQNAADALEAGESQSAQNALSEASEQLDNLSAEQQRQQNASESLSESADSAQQASEEIAQSEQQASDPQASDPQEGDPQASDESQSQTGDPQAGQEGQEGQEGQQGEEGNQGEQGEEGDSSQSDQQGQNPGDGTSPSDQQGQQPGDQPSQNSAQNPTGAQGDGAGDGDNNQQQSDNNAQDSSDGQDNNADGQGVSEFEAIYAPQRLSAEGNQDIVLEPDASDMPVVEGEFRENPDGNASVPYNQVFADYANAASRALESDYVPLGLRDVVRDYFIGITPNGNNE